jgi:hypothetical protein
MPDIQRWKMNLLHRSSAAMKIIKHLSRSKKHPAILLLVLLFNASILLQYTEAESYTSSPAVLRVKETIHWAPGNIRKDLLTGEFVIPNSLSMNEEPLLRLAPGISKVNFNASTNKLEITASHDLSSTIFPQTIAFVETADLRKFISSKSAEINQWINSGYSNLAIGAKKTPSALNFYLGGGKKSYGDICERFPSFMLGSNSFVLGKLPIQQFLSAKYFKTGGSKLDFIRYFDPFIYCEHASISSALLTAQSHLNMHFALMHQDGVISAFAGRPAYNPLESDAPIIYEGYENRDSLLYNDPALAKVENITKLILESLLDSSDNQGGLVISHPRDDKIVYLDSVVFGLGEIVVQPTDKVDSNQAGGFETADKTSEDSNSSCPVVSSSQSSNSTSSQPPDFSEDFSSAESSSSKNSSKSSEPTTSSSSSSACIGDGCIAVFLGNNGAHPSDSDYESWQLSESRISKRFKQVALNMGCTFTEVDCQKVANELGTSGNPNDAGSEMAGNLAQTVKDLVDSQKEAEIINRVIVLLNTHGGSNSDGTGGSQFISDNGYIDVNTSNVFSELTSAFEGTAEHLDFIIHQCGIFEETECPEPCPMTKLYANKETELGDAEEYIGLWTRDIDFWNHAVSLSQADPFASFNAILDAAGTLTEEDPSRKIENAMQERDNEEEGTNDKVSQTLDNKCKNDNEGSS